MRIACLTLLVAAIALSTPGELQASAQRIASIEELAKLADAVVVARVHHGEGEWLDHRIQTRHHIELTDVWKGPMRVPGALEILTLGGRVGDLGQRVSGQVSIAPGAEVVLFLAWDPGTQGYRPVGLRQGVFTVTRPTGSRHGIAERQSLQGIGDAVVPLLAIDLSMLRDAVLEVSSGR